jgi:HD-like signal output (HDOD) protein/ActR/RegA family two-component response regulator
MNAVRVLFVDDDPNVLESLKSLLRRRQREWEMEFVGSGAAALALLAARPFDAIVTDMQMPEMDGAELLERVKREHPRAARIVLSGHAGRTAVLRSLSLAHRFLSKPCDARTIVAVVDATLQLQRLLNDATLRTFVGQIGSLPPAPETFMKLTRAIESEHVTTSALAAIVESDPATAAKVLQLVNSAFFGLSRPVTSIQQAIGYLGVELLKGVVLSIYVFDTAVPCPPPGLSLTALRGHSMVVAKLARAIAGPLHGEAAFAAGVVHDIGKIVLGVGRPDMFGRLVRLTSDGRSFIAAEKELARVTHAEIGAYLLGMWGLPFDIVEATAFHHQPSAVPTGDRRLLAALHVADALAQHRDDQIDHAFLAAAGFADEFATWQKVAAELTEAAAA